MNLFSVPVLFLDLNWMNWGNLPFYIMKLGLYTNLIFEKNPQHSSFVNLDILYIMP